MRNAFDSCFSWLVLAGSKTSAAVRSLFVGSRLIIAPNLRGVSVFSSMKRSYMVSINVSGSVKYLVSDDCGSVSTIKTVLSALARAAAR